MENRFDEITYTQSLFRTLLDCMSRPGKIGQIKPASCGLSFSFTDYTLGVAITLLDQEVTFHIYNDRNSSSVQLQMYTMSQQVSMEECDYFFVNEDENFDVRRLKKGSLEFPDESATVIYQVHKLSEERILHPGAIKLQLQGPGIRDTNILYIYGLNQQVIEPWHQCNQEFPLGLDWIFVDEEGKVCCIPRSTRFSWEVF